MDSLGRLKKKPLLAVAGCLVGRYGQAELASELPEVDIWLPTNQLPAWPAILAKALPGIAIRNRLDQEAARPKNGNGILGADASLPAPESAGIPRLLSTGPAYAWLKIGEGCRHKCAFCTIPSIRGPLVSEPLPGLVAEARELLACGVRELALVAQDVTSYASDCKDKSQNLIRLLAALAELPGLAWLRLLYCYPAGLNQELLAFMASAGLPLLKYLDIPLQHAHPEILAKMGRPFASDPEKVLDRVRGAMPDCAIRTTFIVGYPGESEAHFGHLCRFVEKQRFRHLGVFAWQAEEGTKAFALPDHVPVSVREERRKILMDIQAEISADLLRQELGKRQPVLVDSANPEWPGLHNGRVWFQAPEVDGLTYVSGPGVRPGAMPDCEIVDSAEHDLTALA